MLIQHSGVVLNSPRYVTFGAVNQGRSPAWIARAELHSTVTHSDKLYDVINYFDHAITYTHQKWVVVGEEIGVDTFDLSDFSAKHEEDWEQILSQERRLWLHGIVRYGDGLSDIIHTSKFCYWYVPSDPPKLIMDGPDGANACN